MIEAVRITKEQLKNAQVISPYERILEDGTKIYTNAKGDISNRLLSWKLKQIQRNKYTDRRGINAYLNLISVPQERLADYYVPNLRMVVTMQDSKTKSDYLIPINIGATLNMILMRSKIKNATSVNKLKNDFVRQHYDEIIITQLYKDMLSDNCKFPVIVDESKIDNKITLTPKINVMHVDEGIPVLV